MKMSIDREAAWNVVYNELRDQEGSVAGPPSRRGMAWAIVNALTTAGFDVSRDDHAERVAANLEDFRS